MTFTYRNVKKIDITMITSYMCKPDMERQNFISPQTITGSLLPRCREKKASFHKQHSKSESSAKDYNLSYVTFSFLGKVSNPFGDSFRPVEYSSGMFLFLFVTDGHVRTFVFPGFLQLLWEYYYCHKDGALEIYDGNIA